MKAAKIKSVTLKCDGPDCDWKLKVQMSDIPEWHNVKCPKCRRHIIINDDDMKAMHLLEGAVKVVNLLLPDAEGPVVNLKISTGR